MKGEQVRCIYAEGAPFVEDAVYTLAQDQRNDGKWMIDGFAKWWNQIRFVSVHGVRCIDNSVGTAFLKVGRVYKVIKAQGDYHYVLDLSGPPGSLLDNCWPLQLFEQVWGETISNASSKNYDPDEERLWMLMRPHIGPDECVCGIKRIMCDYHRI